MPNLSQILQRLMSSIHPVNPLRLSSLNLPRTHTRSSLTSIRCLKNGNDDITHGDKSNHHTTLDSKNSKEHFFLNGIFSNINRRKATIFLASFASLAGISKLLKLDELLGFGNSKANAATTNEFANFAQMKVLTRTGDVSHSDDEWKQILSSSEYKVLRKEGTEMPFSSPLNQEKRAGVFRCKGCGNTLFNSTAKFNSGTGWPSFVTAIPGSVDEVPDFSIFIYPRTEIRCHACQSHLGHVFDDGPQPTGKRYCMNGVALSFEPSEA